MSFGPRLMRAPWRAGISGLIFATALAHATAAQPVAAPASSQKYGSSPFDAIARQADFDRTAKEFVDVARKGDLEGAQRLITASVAARTGSAEVALNLSRQVFPFFATFKSYASSSAVTQISNADGFAYYMYMIDDADRLRPFVIWIVEENGRKSVANILVDHFVATRHCAKRPNGDWKCPDGS
jgi:hypothetical protein